MGHAHRILRHYLSSLILVLLERFGLLPVLQSWDKFLRALGLNEWTTFALLLRRKWIAFLARCRLPTSASSLLLIGCPLDLL